MENYFNTKNFDEAVRASGYTMAQIAELIPCRVNDLYRYRKGEVIPRFSRLKKLIEILGPTITGLKISSAGHNNAAAFSGEKRKFLFWFSTLSRMEQVQMLGAIQTIYEFGPTADIGFAADFATALTTGLKEQKEQPG